ncbi:MAG TPA: TadE/TadG family type IV pilus assembly protein [Caulobacteraceae bacterium]|nr:TadE/TadG family type IV pilus assembly protein [Caulobacteraceae bacterium]
MRDRTPSPVRRLAKDQRGLSTIEFAFVGPVLILAYFGLAELCGAMLAERKASHTASAIGDLVAQATSIHDSDISNIFAIGGQIMAPDPSTTLGMRISSIQENAAGTSASVAWSDASGTMTANAVGATMTLPSNLVAANQSIIRADVSYTYNVPVAYLLPSAFTYTETFYLRPRLVDPIPRVSP